MPYYYSDPSRESEPYALPNIWVVERDASDGVCCPECSENVNLDRSEDDNGSLVRTCPECKAEVDPADFNGWYWAPCFPGYLPDGDFNGPFDSVQAAVDDMRNTYDD